jgi:hypothetical protein
VVQYEEATVQCIADQLHIFTKKEIQNFQTNNNHDAGTLQGEASKGSNDLVVLSLHYYWGSRSWLLSCFA